MNWAKHLLCLDSICIALECRKFCNASDDLGVDLFHGLRAIDNEISFRIHQCNLQELLANAFVEFSWFCF